MSGPLQPSQPFPVTIVPVATDCVDVDQLFKLDAQLRDLVTQRLRPRHFRTFRRAKAIRRFIRHYEPALAVAGLSVDQRARLVVLGSAIVREAETDDWARLSVHADNVIDVLRSCVFGLRINLRAPRRTLGQRFLALVSARPAEPAVAPSRR